MRDFHLPGRSPVLATNGMCATSHPLAAQVAIRVMQDGGNAMDAAIAGAVLLGLCEPHMTGLGGDCFVLWSRPGDPVSAYNGSGRAPAAASAAALRDRSFDTVPLNGPEAVTIPGAVEAFCTLSRSQGKIGLDRILAPSIHYAEAGVPVAPRVAQDWPDAGKALRDHGVTHFTKAGRPLKTGDIFRAPALAEVLRRIARHGPRAFYEGEVAEDMLAALAAKGGVHTGDDFERHSGTPTTPVQGHYRGTDIIQHPPNGQGPAAILMLNILSRFDMAALDPMGPERLHLEIEATKLAYDARNRILADPDHTARLDHMLSDETAARLAALIDPARVIGPPAPLTEAVHRDTVYITTVDSDRMAVSLIYSIFHGFGSGIASEKFGILMQNRGAGFTLEEGHPNEMAGGKRPMHTIIPGMLGENGAVTVPFGVMGGAYQPAGHARFASNLIDYAMDPQTAIDAPRAFAEGGRVKLEKDIPDATARALADLGHDVFVGDAPIGGAQAILMHDSGVLEGASDARKDGCALGY